MSALVALTVLLDVSAPGAELLARGITLPTYLPDGSLPAVVTRMAWMEKDYYQRGFLQFGMLPITVGRDVVMEVRQPEALAAALEGIQGWRKAPGKGRAVELRDFCLKLRLPDGPHELRAGRVRFGERGAVFLAQGVVWTGPQAMAEKVEEAELQTAGPDAGRLVWHTADGPVVRWIFGRGVPSDSEDKSSKATKK